MSKYIDCSVAIARLTALEVTEPNATMADTKRVLADIPAADVAPVGHGEWIPISDGEWAECSECGEGYEVSDNGGMTTFKLLCEFYKYCPNCGAKMDEKEAVYD